MLESIEPTAASPDEGPSVLLGRQPIVDRTGALVAYELLFHGHDGTGDSIPADDPAATEQVILNAIAQFGVAGALGPHRGFVHAGRDALGSDSLLLLEPARFTIVVRGADMADAAVPAACLRLRQAGFQIALDDVAALPPCPPRVLEAADIVRVDPHGVGGTDLSGLVAAAHAAGCAVLATQVETREQYRWLYGQGVDLFQGYFFARPELLRQHQVSPSQAALLKLVGVLASDPSLARLQLEVKRHPMLLAQLMKLAGSALVAGRPDLTVGEAIARVGTRQLARLAQLLLFASGGQLPLEDDPLLQLVHTRARFLELLAESLWPEDAVLVDAAFQTGIYSLMHVVTLQPSEELLAQVGTSLRIRLAILQSEGRLGDLLQIAEFMEGFRADRPAHVLTRHGLCTARIGTLFARATGEILSST